MKPNFFTSLREKMMKSPSRKVDQFILKRASDHFELNHAKKTIPWWSIATGSTVAALALVVWLQVGEDKTPKAMLAESPEMLMEMENVEQYMELAQLSDEEWNIVMNGES